MTAAALVIRPNNAAAAFGSSRRGRKHDALVFAMQALPTPKSPTALCAINEEEKDYVSPMRERECYFGLVTNCDKNSAIPNERTGPRPKGGDTAYTNENILRQLRYYNDIRKVGGADCTQDIYARDPNTEGDNVRFWFVGKIARCTGTVSSEQAAGRLFNLIEEHATRIRPVELGRCFGSLDFYSAPGDTELLTSQNDPNVRLRKLPRYVEGAENVALLEVGLNLEILTNQGVGFCIVRTEDGVVPPSMLG